MDAVAGCSVSTCEQPAVVAVRHQDDLPAWTFYCRRHGYRNGYVLTWEVPDDQVMVL